MRIPRRPAFLAPMLYRRRRVADAARVLPVAGAFLVLLPILWRPAETAAPDTSRGGIYLFAVWFGLIVVAFLLAGRLGRDPETPPTGRPGAAPGGGPAAGPDADGP